MSVKLLALTGRVSLILALWSGAGNSQTQPPVVGMENLDAICKTAPVPTGFVTVGELNSPECGTNPTEMNAWYVDKVRHKIVSCTLPDYSNGQPPAILYRVCKRVLAPACAPRTDGGPNGYELGSIDGLCDGPYASLIQNCARSRVWNGFRQFSPADDGCKAMNAGTAPAYPFPVCIDNNDQAIFEMGWRIVHRAFLSNSAPIRLVFSDACPPMQEPSEPNVMIVATIDEKQWQSTEGVFVCAFSVRRIIDDKDKNTPIPEGTFTYRHKDGWEITAQTFHDDRCGVENGINTAKIRVTSW